MTDKRDGLVIRRKVDKDAAEGAEEAAKAAAEAAELAATTAEADARAKADRERAEAATAEAEARAKVERERTEAQRVAKGSAASAVEGRVWRDEQSAPRVPEAAPARAATPPRPREMPTVDDFAAMLGDAPMTERTVEVGDRVRATVVSVGTENFFVALGGKSEGVMSLAEFKDESGAPTVAVGDEIEAVVVNTRGEIRLATALGGNADAGMLEDAAANGLPVEGKIVGTNKGGFEVQVMGSRGFCPFSQLGVHTEEPDSLLGNTYTFLIQRVEEGGRNVVVSRTALQAREREERAGETLQRIAPGVTFTGTVSRVADFGVFVDIGGVDGLVHISEMSWARLDHPSELVKEGDAVTVSVLRVDDLHDEKHRRIALSMKNESDDPWMTTMRTIQVGDAIVGKVTRLQPFGAFVEIAPGIDGLVHISELAQGKRIHHPKEVVALGDDVQVAVLSMDPQKRQIALSMKALMDDPWGQAAKAFPRGTTVQGTVESVQKFGVFIELEGGISALLPLSQLAEGESQRVHALFRAGMPAEARVLDIDVGRRRLTLTRRDDAEHEEREAFAEWKQATASRSDATVGMGTFADLLKNRKA